MVKVIDEILDMGIMIPRLVLSYQVTLEVSVMI